MWTIELEMYQQKENCVKGTDRFSARKEPLDNEWSAEKKTKEIYYWL